MTKKKIALEASLGISEDINGELYTIYDFNKVYSLVIDKACEWLKENFNQVVRKHDDIEVIHKLFTNEIEESFKKSMEE